MSASYSRQNCKPYNLRRLLAGDDPHGFKLRDDQRNNAAVRIALNHECNGSAHTLMDLMDDTPDGDVCVGLCCGTCDYERIFPYQGKLQGRSKSR